MKNVTDNSCKPVKLLFVCLGNICRSPAAHAVMEHMVAEAGLSSFIEIDSCGVGSWHVGQLPDSRMRRHGAQRGYRVDHRARQFSKEDFDNFDRIIVMDADNYRAVTSMASNPAQVSRVVPMGNFLEPDGGYTTVPDPYYGGDADFELALDLIEQGCHRLLADIKKQSLNKE